MFATFAVTNTIPQQVTPTTAFPQEPHLKTFLKIGYAPSVALARVTSAPHKK